MIKRIQQYLLENYPLLWNIRLLPISIIILSVNILFFLIGYISTDTTFNGYRYYNIFDNLWPIYFASIVIAIIIFIGWLILYLRNNALKVFYPRKNVHVFLEWTLSFIICIGITFIPYSLFNGATSKWKASTSIDEAADALLTIYKAKILIPSDTYSYTYDSESHDMPIPVPESIKNTIKYDSINLSKYSFEYNKNSVTVNGYIGASLLFYDSHQYYSYYLENLSTNLSKKNIKKEIENVKIWLQTEDSVKIKALMTDYMSLIKKHKLSTSINVDEWFNRIYNPPYFAVDTSSVILGSIGNSGISIGDTYYNVRSRAYSNRDNTNYLSIYVPEIDNDSLEYGYETILSNYNHDYNSGYFILTCLSIAVGLSILVFSYRVVGAKKWLKTLLFTAIFSLCLSLLTAILAATDTFDDSFVGIIFISSWIILLIICLYSLISRVIEKKEKKASNVAMATFIWFIPCIIPLVYSLIAISQTHNNSYILMEQFTIENMFWSNIVITIIAMYPSSILIRKWKSLSEE